MTGRALRGLATLAVAVCGLFMLTGTAQGQQSQSPLEIGGMSHTVVDGLSIIVVGVENTGQIALDASGELELVDSQGDRVTIVPVSTGEIPAGDTSVVAVPLGIVLDAGHYTASLTLVDEAADVRADSGLRQIPVGIVATEPTPFPDLELPDTEAEPDETGFPSWLLLLIGITLTVAGVTYMRASSGDRKPSPARPVPEVSMIRKVKVRSAPPKRPATIKPLLPPNRRNDGKPS